MDNFTADVAVVDVSQPASPALTAQGIGGGFGLTVNPVTNRFYTTNGYGGDILVYDGATNARIATVHKGYCHASMDTDPTTNLIYSESQCGAFNDPVQVLDGATNQLVSGALGTGGVASVVKVNPATHQAYATANGAYTRVFGPSPNFPFLHDLPGLYIAAVNPVTNRLYFYAGSDLKVYDGSSDSFLATIPGPVGANTGYNVAVNTSLNRIYVGDSTINGIDVIDGATNMVIQRFSLGSNISPVSTGVDSSRNLVFVTAHLANGMTDLYVLQDAAGATVTQLGVSAPASSTAGTPFNLTVTAEDAAGHTVPGYTGTVHFTSSDLAATLPADYTFTASDNGVHTFSVTLRTAGSRTISVRDTANSSITGSTSVTVNPAAASGLAVAGFPSPSTAGAINTFSVTAQDAYGNTVPGYRGTVHFTSSDRQAVLPADYTFTSADNGLHVFGGILKTAGSQSLTATDTSAGSVTGTQSGIVVTPAAASAIAIGVPAEVTAGALFAASLTVQDAYGNTVPSYTGTVHVSTNLNEMANYTFTAADQGTHTFTLRRTQAGTRLVTATDTMNPAITGSATFTVAPAAASHFALTAPAAAPSGTPFDLTVTALDPYDNVDTRYAGTVIFITSDPDPGVVLPPDYAFTTADQGVHTFAGGVTLITPGDQFLTVRDVLSGIHGTATVTVTDGPLTSVPGSGCFASLNQLNPVPLRNDPSPVVGRLDQLFANGVNGTSGSVPASPALAADRSLDLSPAATDLAAVLQTPALFPDGLGDPVVSA